MQRARNTAATRFASGTKRPSMASQATSGVFDYGCAGGCVGETAMIASIPVDTRRRAILVVAVLAAALLALAIPAAAQQVLLSSDCPDGAPVCRVERAVAKPTAPKPVAEAPTPDASANAAGASAGAVLTLSNLDLGATRSDLDPRLEPTTTASATASTAGGGESVAIDALPVAVETEPVSDWGSEPEREEVWVSVEGSETVATVGGGPTSFDECMEVAIRGDVPFTTARQVCMALFAQAPLD